MASGWFRSKLRRMDLSTPRLWYARAREAARTARDAIDRLRPLPDSQILMYAVITMCAPSARDGSRPQLLGQTPTERMVHSLVNEMQLTDKTPPTAFVYALDDRVVPVESSLLFHSARRTVNVPAELYVT